MKKGLALSLLLLVTGSPTASVAFGDVSGLEGDPLIYRQWFYENYAVFGDAVPEGFGILKLDELGLDLQENIVMVVAPGVETSHEDLKNKLWVNEYEIPDDGIDNDGNGYIDDINGINVSYLNGDTSGYKEWGTRVSGVIAAEINNGVGIRGLSPKTKILPCVFAPNDVVGYLDTISILNHCIDYSKQLKNLGAKVDVVVSPFSFVRGNNSIITSATLMQSDYDKIHDEYVKLVKKIELEDILFVHLNTTSIELGEDEIFPLLPDHQPIFPLYYHSPNVVAVSSMDREGHVVSSPAIGMTAWVPSEDILTTSALPMVNQSDKYILNLSPETTSLSMTGSWEVSSEDSFTGSQSWKFPHNGEVGNINFPKINLNNAGTKELLIDVKVKKIKDYFDPGYYNSYGWLNVEYNVDGTDDWIAVTDSYYKSRALWDDFNFSIPLAKFNLENAVNLNLRLRSYQPGNTIYVDDIKIGRIEDSVTSDGYVYWSNNGAAMAFIAGNAALIRSAHKDWKAWRVKNAIATAGTSIPIETTFEAYSLLGKKVYKTYAQDGHGALDCNDVTLKRRLYPISNAWIAMTVNDSLTVKTLSINCSVPGDTFTLKDEKTGETFYATDDGMATDSIAGDGTGIAKITFERAGVRHLQHDGSPGLPVYVMEKYTAPKKVKPTWYDTDNNEYLAPILLENKFKFNLGGIKFSDVPISYTYNGLTSFRYSVSSDGSITNPKIEVNAKSDCLVNCKSNVPQSIEVAEEFKFDLVTNRSINKDLLISKGFNTVRIYSTELSDAIALPAIDLDTQIEFFTYHPLQIGHSLKVSNGESNRYLIYNLFAPGLTEQFGVVAQLAFKEGSSSILFNFGELPSLMQGKEVEIGIEIGESYSNRKNITLESNTSYLMTLEGIQHSELNISLPNALSVTKNDLAIDVSNYVSGDNNDFIGYQLLSGSEHFSLSSNGVLTVKNCNYSSPYKAEVLIHDSESEVVKNIEVICLNQLPEVNLPEAFDISLEFARFFTVDFDNYLFDADADSLVVYLKNDDSSRTKLDGNVFSKNFSRFEYEKNGNSTTQHFIVSDGKNEVDFDMQINLQYLNSPPQLRSESRLNFTLNSGTSLKVDLLGYIYDPQADSMTFKVVDSSLSIEKNKLTINYDKAGVYQAGIVATDIFGATEVFPITVTVVTDGSTSNQDNSKDGGNSGGVIEWLYIMLLSAILFYRHQRLFRHSYVMPIANFEKTKYDFVNKVLFINSKKLTVRSTDAGLLPKLY